METIIIFTPTVFFAMEKTKCSSFLWKSRSSQNLIWWDLWDKWENEQHILNQTYIPVFLRSFFMFFPKTDNIILEDPCFHPGYIVNKSFQSVFDSPCVKKINSFLGQQSFIHKGLGDWNKCHEAIKKVFNTTYCRYSRCSFNDIFQPPVEGRFGVRTFRKNMGYLLLCIKWKEYTEKYCQYCET